MPEELEAAIHEYLNNILDGMVESWVLSASYISNDGTYQSLNLTAPDQLLHTSLGLVSMADALYVDQARNWGRDDATE